MESGLLNLRAELLKKKAEINKTSKLEAHPEIKPLFKEKKISKQKTKSAKVIPLNNEETLKLEKSKQALERKALLYDKIKSGTKVLEDDELNERFLVNFQGKIYNEVSELSSNKKSASENTSSSKSELAESKSDLESDDYKARTPSEEWAEYTDSFGRTRICLREDLENMQKKDGYGGIKNVHKEKWEQIEEQLNNKDNIHYQDVLFDEARSHGTAFMPFSRDEKEREAQQQLLKDIGSQANKVHLTKEGLKKKRQKMMEQRLTKVRQKKRLKMGLPVKDIDVFKTPPASDDEEEEDKKNCIENETKEEITGPLNPTKNDAVSDSVDKPVREWDIGKPGVTALMSQKQWIESRRKERENEFAPPSNYETNNFKNQKKKQNNDMPINKRSHPISSADSNDDIKETRTSEFAPPATYEYFRSTVNKRTKSSSLFKVDLEAAISKGISEFRKKSDNLS